MKKAVLRFTPLEYAYQEKFGIMPDYHYMKLLQNGLSLCRAGQIVNANMDKIWTQLKEEYRKKEAFVPVQNVDEIPF